MQSSIKNGESMHKNRGEKVEREIKMSTVVLASFLNPEVQVGEVSYILGFI